MLKQKGPIFARYILGLIYFIFGALGLFQLLPPQPDMPERMQLFMTGLLATGYFFPLLKGTETICGLMILAGVAPALMLVILAPITINIFLLHSFLTPGLENIVLPLFMVIMHVWAAQFFLPVYKNMFRRHRPN